MENLNLNNLGAIIITGLVAIVFFWPRGGMGQVIIERLWPTEEKKRRKAAGEREGYRAPTAAPEEATVRFDNERTKYEIERQEYQRVIKESNDDIQALIDQLREAGIEPARKLNGKQTRAANGELPAVELVNMMEMAFDADDLDDILLQMGIEPGAISGETLIGKMRNLVRYCQRRGRLIDLVNICRRERPRLRWPDIL